MEQNKTCWTLDVSKISGPSGFTQSDGGPSPKAFSDPCRTTALSVISALVLLLHRKYYREKKVFSLPLTPNTSRPVVRDVWPFLLYQRKEMLPGSWSVARKNQNNRSFVQRRDWVPPGTEKQLLMGQQDFLFLNKAVQLAVQSINLMARYGSNRAHSRVPLCSSIPRDARVHMGKESHILSCRVKRSAHGCCQAASALLWKEAFISMPSDQEKKKKATKPNQKPEKSFIAFARNITFSGSVWNRWWIW